MTRDDLEGLRIGDLVRHKEDGEALTVIVIVPNGVVAARMINVTNPPEWDKVDKNGKVISSD